MELNISLPGDKPKEAIIHLSNYLQKASIDGLEKLEIDRGDSKPDQMGVGIMLNSVSALIVAAQKPLVELIKCLQKYVDNYKTDINITTGSGKILKISKGRNMTAKELQDLLVAIKD